MFAPLIKLLPTGVLVVLTIATVTSLVVALVPAEEPRGIQFWVIVMQQRDSYVEKIAEWNRQHPGLSVRCSLGSCLARR